MSEADISGSGGKSGGGSTFFEADDTLKSVAVVRVVEIISEGEIVGVVDGRKGVYLNNVPVQNQDGTENFGGNVAFQERVGLPDQPSMSGFPSATAEFSIGTQITNASGGVIYTTLSDTPTIHAVRVTVGLNDGLAYNDTSSNQLKGTEVELAIDRRLGAGTWEEVKRFEIRGKATSAYEEGHRIERPLGAGTWSIRVRRITADNSSATLKNNTYLARVAEIQDVNLAYENTAYVGLAVDARSVASSSVPTRSYHVKGIKVKVPSNYNPVTRTYTGQWNGLFKTAFEWTNNPAWILYDYLCHPRYGLGEWVTEDLVDKYSFYNAAVYCDELVNKYDQDGNLDGQEPRFTFNYQIMARQDANKWLQDIAGMMNAKLVWLGNKATLIQDRPVSVSRLVTNSNVIDGVFSYKSTSLQDRITAVLVTWNNPEAQYHQEVAVVDHTTTRGSLKTLIDAAQLKYGYNSDEIVALGCTSEYQARRAGAWKLDTALSQTEIVSFKMFVNGYDLFPGEVISLFDQHYAGAQLAGKLLSGATTTSLPLDRSVTISAGASISVMLPNGTVETKTVTQGAGTYSTLTASTALSAAPNAYADFIVTSAISPRQFKVTKTSLDQEGHVQVEAVLHDPNKYSRVEEGTNITAPIFSTIASSTLSAPTALLFKEVSVNIDNTIIRSLNISWQRPLEGVVSSYNLQWQVDSGGWQTVTCLSASTELTNLLPGVYEVRVTAVGVNGVSSPELKGSYTVSVVGGQASALSAVTGLGVVPGGGTSFGGRSLTVQWTNPAANANVTSTTIRDFEVAVLTTADVVLRTTFIPGVLPGQTQNYTYDYDANLVDGGPRRSFKVRVKIRDANNNFSSATVATFSNSAPAAVSLTVNSGFQNNTIKWTKPTDTDYKGMLLWGSTSASFTPSVSNLIAEGDISAFVHAGLADSTTWYYKAAPYDEFGKDYGGSGLNVSVEASGTTSAGYSTNEWELNGVTWTPNSPGTNQVSWSACTSVKIQGSGAGGTTAISAGNATWSSGVLYIYHEAGAGTLSSTTSLATALANSNRYIVATYRGGTNLEVGNGRAYMDGGMLIAGSVGATQVTTGELITQSAQIKNATVNDGHFTGLLTAAKIDTRGLTIKDANGTTIFSSGVPLAPQDMLSAAGSNIVINYGRDNVVSLDGNSTIDNDAAATSGKRLKFWAGWTAGVTLNVAGAERQPYSFILGKTYRVYARVARTAGADSPSTFNFVLYNWGTGLAPIQGDLLSGTSGTWTVVYLGSFVANWSNDHNVTFYWGDGSMGGNSSTKFAVVDWLYFQPVNVDEGATVGATIGSNFRDSLGNLLPDASLANNLLDASWWKLGLNPLTVWPGNQDGTGAADELLIGSGWSGESGIFWRATQGSTSQNGGGWNPGGAGNSFTPDPNKTYRFLCPVWLANGTGDVYWGVSWSTVCDLNTTTTNGNPYFVGEGIAGKGGVWYLMVGYVFPYGSTGHSNDGAGVYRMTDGVKVSNGTNFNWAASPGTGVGTRAYQFYATSGQRIWFGRPMVHQVNGSEPTLDSILSSGAVSGRNKVTSSNISTYIDSGAIGNAYIGNFIQSTDFNGTIDGNGNITADGTVGWAIAKGNGASGKAVFQNVKVRGDVQATSVSTTIASTLASAQYSSGGYVSWPNSAAVWDPYPASSALASSAALYLEAGWVTLATATYSADLQFRSTNSPESCGMHVQFSLWSCNSGGTLNAIQAYAFHPHRAKNFWYSNSTSYVLANFPGSFTHMFKITSAGYYRLTLSMTNVYAWDVNSNVVAPGATSTLYTTTNYIGYTIIKI